MAQTHAAAKLSKWFEATTHSAAKLSKWFEAEKKNVISPQIVVVFYTEFHTSRCSKSKWKAFLQVQYKNVSMHLHKFSRWVKLRMVAKALEEQLKRVPRSPLPHSMCVTTHAVRHLHLHCDEVRLTWDRKGLELPQATSFFMQML